MPPPNLPHTRDRADDYLADQIGRLDDELDGLRQSLKEHDGHVQQMLAQALATMLDKLPEALEQATERALRRVATDPELHAQIGAQVFTKALRSTHERVGGWVFSRWGALALIVLAAVQYMGPAATIKALIALASGKGAS